MAYNRPVLAGVGLKQNPTATIPALTGVQQTTLDANISSTTNLGIVQVGSGLSITPSGILSAINGGGPSYSFGSWLPGLAQVSTGSIAINVKHAKYTKVGQLVNCTFDIKITGITGGSDSNSISLINLPFTSIADTASVGSLYISYYKDFDKNVNNVSGTVNGNNTTVTMWYQQNPGKSMTLLTVDDIKINTVLVGTITYISNS